MNFELISYTEYPNDQYTKAICTVRIDGKHVITYGQKCTKEGKVFWTPATHNVNDGAGKEYIQGYMLDSRSDEKRLDDFIRQSAKTSQYNMVKASQNPNVSVSEDSMPPPF